jgi:hypothetical protein
MMCAIADLPGIQGSLSKTITTDWFHWDDYRVSLVGKTSKK